MRNRLHRYNQRSYKHREQERIPEYFVDEEDPIDFCDWYRSLHKLDRKLDRTDVVYSDCESVDSYFVKRKKKDIKPAKTNKKSLASLASSKNRYAALDIEESYTILGEGNKREQLKYPDRGDEESVTTLLIFSCKGETEMDQSKNCLKKGATCKTDAEAERQRLIERNEWIDSWSEKEAGDNRWVITVDGYFRKKRKAGYGVMIRDPYGVPVLASASVYDQGRPVSYIYHTLQGIDRGLELALKYGIQNVELYYTLPHAIDELIQSFLKSRGNGYSSCDSDYGYSDLDYGDYGYSDLDYGDYGYSDLDYGYSSYDSNYGYSDFDYGYSSFDSEHKYAGLINSCEGKHEFQLVSPLFREIVQKCRMFVDHPSKLECSSTKRRYNIPADYLAKLQVTKKEMKPDEFSEELKDILYADAHNWEMMDYISVNQQKFFIRPKRMNT